MHCESKVQMCRARMMPCDHVGSEDSCPYYNAGCNGKAKLPTLGNVIQMYAAMCGPTLSDHQRQVLRDLRRMMSRLGLTDETRCDAINYDSIDAYIRTLEVRNISKIGTCQRIQSVFGRRARMFYRRGGWTVQSVDVPPIEDDSVAYKSLRPDQVLAVLGWYRGLQFRPDRRARIFAMMMLKYAMRNSDVELLRWSNFDQSGINWRLRYTPHKTEKSTAGRSVTIWLDTMDQIELDAWRGDAANNAFVIPRARGKHGLSLASLQAGLNAELRAIGFGGSKGLYELRKLCIDTVFHLHGAEAAAAYSGDDYKTVKFHYSDPSSLNLRGISDNSFGTIIGCGKGAA